MRYFKELDDNGRLIAIGAGDAMNGVDITREEYEELVAYQEETNNLSWKLYHREITAEDVPEEWREEVVMLSNEIAATRGAYDPNQTTGNEALDIITGAITR